MKLVPIFLLFLVFIIPRFFYGAEIYTLWDSNSEITFLSSIGIVGNNGYLLLSEAVDLLDNLASSFGVTSKRLIFYFSILLSFLSICMGSFFVYQKLNIKRYSLLTGFLLSIHPLLVWLSGEPSIYHFSSGIFSIGILFHLISPLPFFLHSVIGVILMGCGVLLSPALHFYSMIFYFSLLIVCVDKLNFSFDRKKSSAFNPVCALGLLMTIFIVSILGKDTHFFTNAPKTLTQSVIELISFLTAKDLFINLAIVTRTMVKAYFSPVIFIAPLILFLRPLRKKELFPLLSVGFLLPIFQLPKLVESDYHLLYSSVFLLTIATTFSLKEMIKVQKIPLMKSFLALSLVGILLVGLGVRVHRDYHRRQSMVSVSETLIQRSDTKGIKLYTPFGKLLPVKGFIKTKNKLNLKIVPIFKNLKKDKVHLLLGDSTSIFLFIDDYFIYEAYWSGEFWRQKNLDIKNLKVELISLVNENSPNVGRLFKISKKK
jgi:hypothetical protein